VTVDPELLAARLAKVRQSLELVARAESVDTEALAADEVLRAAVERGLHVAIEGCLDIGHHVIAREGYRRPSNYQDVFVILGERGVISGELADRLGRAAQLRNRLVHLYWDVDPAQLHAIATTDVADLKSFLAAVVTYFGLAPAD
jgi:uncharacterized protein YutE (UPF0331/DUF86 family)